MGTLESERVNRPRPAVEIVDIDAPDGIVGGLGAVLRHERLVNVCCATPHRQVYPQTITFYRATISNTPVDTSASNLANGLCGNV